MKTQKPIRRILGLTLDSRKPIFAPRHSHSLLTAAAGSGKTSAGLISSLQSIIGETNRCIIVTDVKEGEIAFQTVKMSLAFGRKVAIVDPFGLFRKDHPHYSQVVTLNPFNGVIDAFNRNDGTLVFTLHDALLSIIEEPENDQKNRYFRDEPRTLAEFCLHCLLVRNQKLATPGAVWLMLSDPEQLLRMAAIEAEEGPEALQALARHVLGMSENKEHWSQHRAAAAKAMQIYSVDSALHRVGTDTAITHEKLVRECYVVYLVAPARYAQLTGVDVALNLQSFKEVVMSGTAPPVSFLLDECANQPLAPLLNLISIIRAYGSTAESNGGTCFHMIVQSRNQLESRYGKHLTETIIENAVIQQWFGGLTSVDEAEKLSRAIGETVTVNHSVGFNSDKTDFSPTISTGKEKLYPIDTLMSLPRGQQIIFLQGVGFIHGLQVRMNEVAPTCHYLTDNPMEGGRLAPEPKVTLPAPKPIRKPGACS